MLQYSYCFNCNINISCSSWHIFRCGPLAQCNTVKGWIRTIRIQRLDFWILFFFFCKKHKPRFNCCHSFCLAEQGVKHP